jgi:spore coat polysaccharide biosynthesis predicted glycosyltransferase SpsG
LIDYIKFKNLTFTFYYGIDNVDKLESIQNCINTKKIEYSNVRIELFNHSNIIKNSLLISAFGVSTLEFLALGMPILSFAHSIKNLQTLHILQKKTNSLINLGFIEDLNSNYLNNTINKIISDKEELMNYSSIAKSTISLNGLEIVSKILINE